MGQHGEKTQAVKLVTCLKSSRDIRTNNPHTVGAFQNMEKNVQSITYETGMVSAYSCN